MDWSARELSIAYMAAGLAAVVTQFFLAARLTSWFGELPVAGGSALLFGSGMLLLALVPQPVSVGAAMALLGAGLATTNSCLSTLYSKATPSDVQGFVMGVSEAARRGAWILGPLWGGFCLVHLGNSSPYVSGAIITLGIFLLLTRLAGLTLIPARNTPLERN
jgi:MFS family permease